MNEKIVNSELTSEFSESVDHAFEALFSNYKIEDEEMKQTIRENLLNKLKTGDYLFKFNEKTQSISLQLSKFQLLQKAYQANENKKAMEKYGGR